MSSMLSIICLMRERQGEHTLSIGFGKSGYWLKTGIDTTSLGSFFSRLLSPKTERTPQRCLNHLFLLCRNTQSRHRRYLGRSESSTSSNIPCFYEQVAGVKVCSLL